MKQNFKFYRPVIKKAMNIFYKHLDPNGYTMTSQATFDLQLFIYMKVVKKTLVDKTHKLKKDISPYRRIDDIGFFSAFEMEEIKNG